MKKDNKMRNVALGAAIVGGAAFIVNRLRKGDGALSTHHKEKEAHQYLVDVYGEEAMEGKKVMIVDEDDHASKTDIAKDVVDYELHK